MYLKRSQPWFDETQKLDMPRSKNKNKIVCSVNYTLREYETLLKKVAEQPRFEDRMYLFKRGLEKIQGGWRAFIKLPQGDILEVSVSKGSYESNLVQFTPKDEFWYIHYRDVKMVDDHPNNQKLEKKATVCEFRTNGNGYWGELVWLGRSENVNGNTALCMFKMIEDALKIGWLYILDDSKIEMEIPVTKRGRTTTKVYFLRVLRPVIEEGLAITWYTKHIGVWPTFCKNWKGIHKESYDQNPATYDVSVKYVRNFPVNSFISQYPSLALDVIQLQKRYLPTRYESALVVEPGKIVRLTTSGEDPELTLHDLGLAIYREMRKEQKMRESAGEAAKSNPDFFAAVNDMVRFCETCLNVEVLKIDSEKSKFTQAVRELFDTQVFEKVRYEEWNKFKVVDQKHQKPRQGGFLKKRTRALILRNKPSRKRGRTDCKQKTKSKSKPKKKKKKTTYPPVEDKEFLLDVMRVILRDKFKYGDSWCRYCGAKIASSFSKSPWGPRKLCTPHYVMVHQHQNLDVSAHALEPSAPINPDANTELKYMNYMINHHRSPEADRLVTNYLKNLEKQKQSESVSHSDVGDTDMRDV